ncbi:hypothetical protein DM828_04505 [Pseudomonas umsongensis]|nr:hypothetical protein [Pseudomonas umsongensis]
MGASLLRAAFRRLIVPTLCVGMPPGTLRVPLSPALLRGSPRWAIHGPAWLNRRPAGLATAQCLRSASVVNGAPAIKSNARRP